MEIEVIFWFLIILELAESRTTGSKASSTISSAGDEHGLPTVKSDNEEVSEVQQLSKRDVTLLDLYSGCGAMSTGLCLGATLSGLNLVTVNFQLHLWCIVFPKLLVPYDKVAK